MLHSANLPNHLWPFAMQTVTYLSNRLISPKCPDKRRTPFELIFGVKPDVSNLRAYGCLAYAYDLTTNNCDTTKSDGASTTTHNAVPIPTAHLPSSVSDAEAVGNKRSRVGRPLIKKVMHEASCVVDEESSTAAATPRNRAHRPSSLTHQRALRAFIDNEDDYSLDELLLHVGEEYRDS